MNTKKLILGNKKKFLYLFIGIIIIIFVFRVVQAKFDWNNNQESVKKSVSLIDVKDYQSEEATIYATGKLESLEQLDIKSELSAKIKKVNFSIGDEVKRGQTILELDNSGLGAQLSQAQANLNQRIAGASKEDIQIYQMAVEAAKADLEKTKSDNEQMISSYEIGLQTAENNLGLGSETLVGTLHSVQPLLASSLVETDNLLGIDNTLANDSFKNILSVLDISKLDTAKNSYYQAKKAKKEYDELIINLDKNSSEKDINLAADKAKEALSIMKTHLFHMQEMLDATLPIGGLTQTGLNIMKTTISTLSASINNIDTALSSVMQGQDPSGKNLNSYKIAYEKSKQDLENAKIDAENIIKIKEISYNQAAANLEKITANPRNVDLASMQAAVSQTAALYNKSIIKSPFDGVIAGMPFRAGDLITAGQIVTSVVNQKGLQVKAYINQKERSLISEGNNVLIEDSYEGIVSNISPSIDSVTKKIEIIIAITSKNVEGLTVGQYINAKILVNSAEDAQKFIIPLASVKVYPDYKAVFFVGEDNLIQEKEVKIGSILGDNVEIASGLNLDDKIISSVAGLSVGEELTVK
jgi:RND family efflux transporter MFP subunit